MREAVINSLLVIAGAAFVTVGLFDAWEPLGWIWVGVALLAAGTRLNRTRGDS